MPRIWIRRIFWAIYCKIFIVKNRSYSTVESLQLKSKYANFRRQIRFRMHMFAWNAAYLTALKWTDVQLPFAVALNSNKWYSQPTVCRHSYSSKAQFVSHIVCKCSTSCSTIYIDVRQNIKSHIQNYCSHVSCEQKTILFDKFLLPIKFKIVSLKFH